MAGKERILVKVLVGHESEMFDDPTPEGHLFRWTCYVRPAPGTSAQFNKSFISKVKFKLHESYSQPTRVIHQSPFQVAETGYGSFSPQIEIYFNYPGAKSIKYTYDMMLQMEKRGGASQEVNLELKHAPTSFIDVARQFGARRKRSSAGADGSSSSESLFPPLKTAKMTETDRSPREAPKSSAESHKSSKKESPKEKEKSKEKDRHREKDKERSERKKEKHREKEKDRERKDKEKRREEKEKMKLSPGVEKMKKSDTPSTSPTVRPPTAAAAAVVPVKPRHAPSKTDRPVLSESDISSPSTSYGSLTPRTPLSSQSVPQMGGSPMSPAEMHKRIGQLTDEEQIFRVAAILLLLPGTNLLPSKPAVSFDIDLQTADPAIISRLCEALS